MGSRASLSRWRCSLWSFGASRDQEQVDSCVAFGPCCGDGDNTLPMVAFFTVPPQRAAETNGPLLQPNTGRANSASLQLPLQMGSLPFHLGMEALRQVSSGVPCRWYPMWQWKRAVPPGSKSRTDTSPKWGLFGKEQLSLKTVDGWKRRERERGRDEGRDSWNLLLSLLRYFTIKYRHVGQFF